MSMSIVHGSYQSIWVPIKPSATIYVGGLVGMDISSQSEGVEMLPDAAGVANKTNNDIPFGIVIGTNRKEPLYSSTYKTEYITDPGPTDPHDGASIEYVLVEGPWAKGDPIAMVKIDILLPGAVIRAPIYNAAVGVAPSVVTCTTGDSNGLTGVFGAINFTPTTDNDSTIYFRSGSNAGAYRVMDAASTTTLAWDVALRNDVAAGDTAVAVPIRSHGSSTINFDATTMAWIDCADAPTKAGTNRWSVNVIRLDLSVAGQEYCDFVFQANHYTNFITPAVGA